MTLLLDTHTFLWFVWDDPQLSDVARFAISDPLNRKLISLASCWEVAIKTSLGKLALDAPVGNFLAREIARNNLELLPISLDHLARVETLPLHHRDPFDRLLVAQALSERLLLISADLVMEQYGVDRLW